MTNVVVHVGNSPEKDAPMESISIEISKPLEGYTNENWMIDSMRRFDTDAKSIVDTLKRHLPGGTFDRVLIRMLEAKCSLFSVPHFETE